MIFISKNTHSNSTANVQPSTTPNTEYSTQCKHASQYNCKCSTQYNSCNLPNHGHNGPRDTVDDDRGILKPLLEGCRGDTMARSQPHTHNIFLTLVLEGCRGDTQALSCDTRNASVLHRHNACQVWQRALYYPRTRPMLPITTLYIAHERALYYLKCALYYP